MSTQSTQPDATGLFLYLRNLFSDIEHHAILAGKNHAHIPPSCCIQTDCSIKISLLPCSLNKLANTPIDLAVMFADTPCNLGIAHFAHCLKEQALDFRIDFDCFTILFNEVFEGIEDILISSARDSFLQLTKKLHARLLEHSEKKPLLAPEMFIEHRLRHFALSSQFTCACLRIGGARKDPLGTLQNQRPPLLTPQPCAFFWLVLLLARHAMALLIIS